MQHQGRRQSADAAADNDRLHSLTIPRNTRRVFHTAFLIVHNGMAAFLNATGIAELW